MCRVWGEHGQAALELARVCVLNCGPTGSEALKNLVLGGIGSFTIVDASKVSASDLGNNYLGERPLTRPGVIYVAGICKIGFHPPLVKIQFVNAEISAYVCCYWYWNLAIVRTDLH